MSQTAILVLGSITILLAVIVMAYFLVSSRRVQQERLKSIIQGGSGAFTLSEGEQRNKRRADLAKKLQTQGKDTEKKKNAIRDLLNYAGLSHVPVKKFWIASAISGVIFVILAAMMKASPLVIGLMFIIGFMGFPKFVLNFLIGRRQKKFLEEFADALESMVRLLKAGMPVGEAIAMAAREFEGPVGEEMARIYDEQKIGIPMAEACVNAARRMPVTEMQMFATGITIQQQTGSSLSEVLLNLAKVIRARFRLKRKVEALSAEAKASAMIIGALPILVAGGLYAVNPEYMEPLFFTPKGKMYLFGAIGWMLMGILIMRQMINFKV
jgi:tight adherence protein B